MKIVNLFKTIFFLTNLEYKALHRTKTFGLIWKFLNPLLFILIYTIVFSTIRSSGFRGFIISMGVLIFSGISSSINSSLHWVQPRKLINLIQSKRKLDLVFYSKIYYNFLPIFYLLPIMVIIQRLFFNLDFKFSIKESLIIFILSNFLTLFTLFYSYTLSVPIAIISKKFTDLRDITTHFLRVSLYLSPILWTARTGNEFFDILLQVLNPFYFIFETLNFIIYRDYNFSLFSLLTPIILLSLSYFYFFRNNKYVKLVKDMIYND